MIYENVLLSYVYGYYGYSIGHAQSCLQDSWESIEDILSMLESSETTSSSQDVEPTEASWFVFLGFF